MKYSPNLIYIILAISLIAFAAFFFFTINQKQKRHVEKLKRQCTELMDVNKRLEEANEKARSLGEYIMSMYKVIEAFNMQGNPQKFPVIIAEYGAKLSGADISFFWADPSEGYESSICCKDSGAACTSSGIFNEIGQAWDNIRGKEGVMKLRAGGHDFLAVNVKSSSRCYGLMGIELKSIDYPGNDRFIFDKLLFFLSELSAAVFERISLEGVSDHLMIVDEQNRIANEIHDSVSQRIFGIICALHSISIKCGSMETSELKKQLESVKDSASIAMRELRSSIYGLSSRKNGYKALSASIREYADGISKLNGIEVDVDISGDEELVPFSMKKALYRIICEAAGNAARHSMCKNIKIVLEFKPLVTWLTIKDDGKGFYLDAIKPDTGGLGLYNMKALAQSFGGQFKIYTKIGGGTEINIVFPKVYFHEEQGGIAQ